MSENKKIKWWTWERAATVHLIYTAAKTTAYPLKKEFGGCYGTLYCFFQNEMVILFCDYNVLVKYGEKIVNDLMDEKYYTKKMSRWNILCKKINKEFHKLETIDLKELSNEELYKVYDEFDKIYMEWWGFGQVAENVGYYCEEELKKKLTADQYKKYFNILVSPTKPSFTNEQEHHLFKIVKEAKDNGFASESVKKLLKEHVKRFHWIQNNFYETKRLDEECFIKEVKKLLKDNINVDKIEAKQKSRLVNIVKKKKEIMDDLGFDNRLRKIVGLVDEFCYIQDLRKKYALIACRFLDLFTMEFSRRFNVKYEIMRWITPSMARNLIKTGEVDIKKLEEIGKCSLVIYHEDNRDDLFTGKEAIERKRKIFSLEKSDVSEIEGVSANQGRVEGYVRVLISPKEIHKMKEGEILVTTMTSPDFVPAMKKAAAIVTDEGGITSHASIVSRELGIPCVIGTKIATKILKTGDFVDVRANHGLVKIIR